MSVREVKDFKAVMVDWASNPRAWVLVANGVWGRAEEEHPIAVFDTAQAAHAYKEASRLPARVTTPDGITRTFRQDSLLWEYNDSPGAYSRSGSMIVPMLPWINWDALPDNPAPPMGACPPMEEKNP